MTPLAATEQRSNSNTDTGVGPAALWTLSEPCTSIILLQNSEYVKFCLEKINRASSRVLVAMGQVSSSHLRRHTGRKLLDTLAETHKRGVKVELFTSSPAPGWTDSRRLAVRQLSSCGYAVFYAPADRAFHYKAVVIDDDLTIIGSHNWTEPHAKQPNAETSVAITSPRLASQTAQAIGAAFMSRCGATSTRLPRKSCR